MRSGAAPGRPWPSGQAWSATSCIRRRPARAEVADCRDSFLQVVLLCKWLASDQGLAGSD
eukprot:scaffold1344_cov388-Prasinococcus_capsulatus_cf.AAC.6